MVNVEKRNGKMEQFQRVKVIVSVRKAGATEEAAQKIADEVESKVHEGMSTSKIKKLVLAMLQKQSTKAAASFRAYKKHA